MKWRAVTRASKRVQAKVKVKRFTVELLSPRGFLEDEARHTTQTVYPLPTRRRAGGYWQSPEALSARKPTSVAE